MLCEWVKKYIGIPFVSNGRAMEGCDCYGLVRLALKNEYGVELPALSDDYEDALVISETSLLFEKHLPVLAAEKLPGPEDGAAVVITERGRPCHLGIAAGAGFILHTTVKTGAVCQRATHPDLRGRVEGYYRVR